MKTPTVTELAPRIEAVTADPFLDFLDLPSVQGRTCSTTRSRAAALRIVTRYERARCGTAPSVTSPQSRPPVRPRPST